MLIRCKKCNIMELLPDGSTPQCSMCKSKEPKDILIIVITQKKLQPVETKND